MSSEQNRSRTSSAEKANMENNLMSREDYDAPAPSFFEKHSEKLMWGAAILAIIAVILALYFYFQDKSQSSNTNVPDATGFKAGIDNAIKKLTEIAQAYVDSRLASEKILSDKTQEIKNKSAESERITKLSETDKASGITIRNQVEASKQAVITAVNTANDAAAKAAATVSEANSNAAATTLVQAENAINEAKILASASLTTITGYLTTAQQSSLFVNNSLVSANSALSYSRTALEDARTLLNKVKSDAEGAPEYTTLVNAANDVKNFVKIIDDTIAVTKSSDTKAKLNEVKRIANQAASDADNTLKRIRDIFGDASSTGTIKPQEAINALTEQVTILSGIVDRIKSCVDTLQSISDGINNTITFINTALTQTQTNIDKLIKMGQDLIAAANAARATADAAATQSATIFQQLGTYPPASALQSVRKENYRYMPQRYGKY